MMSLDPDLQAVIARWSDEEHVEPEVLRGAVDQLRQITTRNADGVSEGEIIYLANVAALMNRDLEKLETQRIMQRAEADR